MKPDSQLKVKAHAVYRWHQRCGWWSDYDKERAEKKLRQMAARGKPIYAKAKRLARLKLKHGVDAAYLRHGPWVVVVVARWIVTVYEWKSYAWRKTPPK